MSSPAPSSRRNALTLQSVQVSDWPSALSIAITRSLTHPKPIALQWVRGLYFFLHSIFTHFILVLHPRHKLAYFRSAGWPQEWIHTAEKLVRSEFKQSYGSRHAVDIESNEPAVADNVDEVCTDPFAFVLILIYLNTQDDESGNIFDRLPALAHVKTSGEELENYLNADIEDIADPIAWWHGHRKTYPHLSRMALDYLTIPGMFCFNCW